MVYGSPTYLHVISYKRLFYITLALDEIVLVIDLVPQRILYLA